MSNGIVYLLVFLFGFAVVTWWIKKSEETSPHLIFFPKLVAWMFYTFTGIVGGTVFLAVFLMVGTLMKATL